MKKYFIDTDKRLSLRKKDDRLAWRDIIFRLFFLFFFSACSAYFFYNHFYYLAILLAIPYFVGFSFLGYAGISHELFHNSVFSKTSTNLFFYKLFSFLTWSNYSFFKVTHWKHHKYTLTDDDPKALFKSTLSIKDLFFLLTIDFPAIFNRLKILYLNAMNIIPSSKHNDLLFKIGSVQRRDVVSTARKILAFHILTIAFFLIFKIYWFIILVNFAPFILTFPNKLLAISQHYATDKDANDNYFRTTRTVRLNRFFSFIYANMNYHVEHHIFPEIPYYNLNRVHELLYEKYEFNYLSYGLTGLIKDLKAKGLFKLK